LCTPISFIPKGTGYTDLTGRFPHISARGNKYLLIVYDFDSNAILSEPLKSRQADEIKKAWEILHAQLAKCGTAPKMHILDNEVSNELKNAMIKKQLDVSTSLSTCEEMPLKELSKRSRIIFLPALQL
jgi:hypothetical protein